MRTFRLVMVVLASVAVLSACAPSTDKLTGTMWKLTVVTVTGHRIGDPTRGRPGRGPGALHDHVQ